MGRVGVSRSERRTKRQKMNVAQETVGFISLMA